jgi:hypothetical protein
MDAETKKPPEGGPETQKPARRRVLNATEYRPGQA